MIFGTTQSITVTDGYGYGGNGWPVTDYRSRAMRQLDLAVDREALLNATRVFSSRGSASHSPPPCTLADSTAPLRPVDPPAPDLPRRTPRARLAARRQLRPVRSRPGSRRVSP